MNNVYDFPFRWEFALNINVDIKIKWVNMWFKKRFEYQQATIKETIEEMDEIDRIGIDKFIMNFLVKCGFNKQEMTLIAMKPDVIENIVETFLTTRYRGIVDKEKLHNPDTAPKDTSWMPYHAVLALIAEKLNIDPITFQNEYTMEQLSYMMNWIEYWINAQTKEWQDINKKKYGKSEEYDNMLINKIRNL